MLKQIWRGRSGYLFILPKFALFIVFVFIPILWSFLVSFQEYRVFDTVWVGLDNFRDAFPMTSLDGRPEYAALRCCCDALDSDHRLILASLINPLRRSAQTFFRAAFYLPTVASTVVLSMVWRWIFGPDLVWQLLPCIPGAGTHQLAAQL